MRNVILKLTEKLGLTVHKSKNLYFHAAGIDCYYFLRQYYSNKTWHTIIDAGANIGQTALKFSRYFPTATIYSFEPVSATYAELKKATQGNQKIKIHHEALGVEPSELEIALFEESQTNSLKVDSERKEAVKVTNLDLFASENGITHIDLLKSDTEGYELEVLAGAKRLLDSQAIDFIYVEVCFSRHDLTKVFYQDITNYLDGHQYHFIGFFEPQYHPENGYANALFAARKLLKE
ncbi:MAG: FkbM family methyltransferase [Chitinophagaceae bacterium]|nr:MAG: FkbM family methyltransferase [Chitinophagaceae bacterium]